MIDFVDNHIVCRFRILYKLTFDQGLVFTGKKVVDYTNDKGIKLLTLTPYYAQANGQGKAINKVIIALIKKHNGRQPRNWQNTLSQILWAYRCSPSEATGTSPYRLVYGHDGVLPVEVNL